MTSMNLAAAPDTAPRSPSLWATTNPRLLGALHLSIIAVGLLAGTAYALLAQSLGAQRPGLSLAMLRAHGVVSVFLCVVPAIPATLGNFALPALVGARAMAFPRVGRVALQLHALGLGLLLVALERGATASSWNLHMAFSAAQAAHSVAWLLAAVVALALSAAAHSLNTVATVHQRGASARPWRSLSPMVWGLYASAALQLLVAPVVLLTGIFALAERTIGLGLFDPSLGGDPLLYSHFVWLYLHPALVSALVAALGVVSHLLLGDAPAATGARIGPALLTLAVLAPFGWAQHLYPVARSEFAVLEASLGAFAFYAPLLWVTGALVRSLRPRALRLDAPTLFALAVVAHLAVITPTGLVLALPSTGLAFEATTFASGHLHYVAVGAVLFALLGGLYRLWPSLTGRAYDERRAITSMALITAGANVSFLSMLTLGGRGVARPWIAGARDALIWRLAPPLGSALAFAGLTLTVWVLGASLRGRPTRASAAAQ